jgi:NADH:ubiquinone oxidoreductase subunit H
MIFTVIINLLDWLIIIFCLLISVAYLTLIERKVLGVLQRRKGPTSVGLLGLLQPFADGFKLIIKEGVLPNLSSSFLFFFSPILFFFLSLLIWSLIPLNFSFVVLDINLSLVYILAITSLSVYGIIISGWSSNSKYSFLGSLRSSAQLISYEVSIGFILLPPAIFTASFNLLDWISHQDSGPYGPPFGLFFFLPFHPLLLFFIISNLAETNRPPFDLPEAFLNS